jgi:hypothetical protein
MLREAVEANLKLVAPSFQQAQTACLDVAQQALDNAVSAAEATAEHRLKQFQLILDRLEPLSRHLRQCRELGMAIAAAELAIKVGQSDQAAAQLKDVRQRCERWIQSARTVPSYPQSKETVALAGSVLKAVNMGDRAADKQVQSVMGLLDLKPKQMDKTVHLQPGSFFKFESDPSKTVAPVVRKGGGCHFPRREAAASWTVTLRRAGRYRIFALLRHSAGIWEDNQFVRGGRNAAYVGRYGWKLDGKPIREEWIGEELNPEDDEALQWAVLADRHLNAGSHTLYAHVTGINHAIVAELVFTQDLSFTPASK